MGGLEWTAASALLLRTPPRFPLTLPIFFPSPKPAEYARHLKEKQMASERLLLQTYGA